MKRWEEAWKDEHWEAIRYKIHIKCENGTGIEVGSFMADVDDGTEDPYSDRGRARLAAQAPAMARLLLEGMTVCAPAEENHYMCLAGCGGYGPTAAEHGSDCALVTTLRAAGVIE